MARIGRLLLHVRDLRVATATDVQHGRDRIRNLTIALDELLSRGPS